MTATATAPQTTTDYLLDLAIDGYTQESADAMCIGDGCECCDQGTTDGWWVCDGKIYRYECALKLERQGRRVLRLLTDAQAASMWAWRTAGIGTD